MASPGFYHENRNRAYPLVPGTGVPDGLLVDVGFLAGPGSGFEDGVHAVYLAKVARSGGTVVYEFRSTAPGLVGVPLAFARSLSGGDLETSFSDTGQAGFSDSSLSDSFTGGECSEPLWSGFVVTGDPAAAAALLPADGSVLFSAPVEPALVQNLAGTLVTRLALANDDRTRSAAPDGCPPVVYPYPTGVVYVHADCLVGPVVVRAGYNAVVRQNTGDNAVTVAAYVGAGEGEPCGTVPLFPGESPPAGSDLVEGGPRCNQTLRSVNGVGGPLLTIAAGPGVTVTGVPEDNRLIVDVGLAGLAVRLDGVSHRSESC